MAPKVVVPADFGIENLYCDLHGNVVLNLKDGQEMRVNSMILSLNSSVFDKQHLKLLQSHPETVSSTSDMIPFR